MKKLLLSLNVACLTHGAIAQILLYDNFDGTSVNTNLWNVVLPFSQSQISESGGALTTTGRGTLETVAGFNSPYVISGAVSLNSDDEHFSVTLRSNLQPGYQSTDGTQYYELTGIKAVFSMDGQEISIQEFTQTNWTMLADTNYSLSVGQTYGFSIADTGSEIDLSVDGTNLLSAETCYATGDQIAFQSREFDDASSSISSVHITSLLNTLFATPTNSGNAIVLSFLTNTNVIYYIQASSNLSNWTYYDGPFLGNGEMFLKTYGTTNQPQCFYRFEALNLESW